MEALLVVGITYTTWLFFILLFIYRIQRLHIGHWSIESVKRGYIIHWRDHNIQIGSYPVARWGIFKPYCLLRGILAVRDERAKLGSHLPPEGIDA